MNVNIFVGKKVRIIEKEENIIMKQTTNINVTIFLHGTG